MNKVLVASDQYNGKYIAIESLGKNKVVGSGKDPEEALKEAHKHNVQNPFILYVPDKDMDQIYNVFSLGGFQI